MKQPAPPSPAEIPPAANVRMAGLLLVAATLAAYRNSLGGPFIFDDLPSIFENPTIARLWPLPGPLSPPIGSGLTVAGRPLVNLSLAVNHAISGTEVWSYHAFNLLVHLLAGLTLFGLVRRTLRRPVLAARFGGRALPVAFMTALLWLVHPLQTGAVTYVVQRAEAMMALCYIATLQAFVRAVEREETAPGRPAWGWRTAAVAACALGMGCKEVMVTAPVAVWLYDRTFVAGSLREALRRRGGFYAALAVTWLPLAWLVAGTGGDRGGTFKLTVAAFVSYGLTQFEALAVYLQRAVWPSRLIFEYGVWKPEVAEILPYAAGMTIVAAATAWAWVRRPVAGFLGVVFFLVLAPTTLMPGVTQVMVEHRMYLPLAAVIALAAGAAVAWFGRAAVAGCLVLALAAGVLTARRNAVYADKLALWEETVTQRPQSALAQSNLATVYYERGRLEEARQHNEISLRLNPESAQVEYNLGLVLEKLGRREEALAHFAAAARVYDKLTDAHYKRGQMLIMLGRAPEALAPLAAARALDPALPEVHTAIGVALAESGRWTEAVAAYERALQLKAGDAETEANLGVALFRLGRVADAEAHVRRALRRDPRLAEAHFNLGLVLAATGRREEARRRYADAVRLAPAKPEARLNYGIALAQAGRLDEARAQLSEAVRLQPDSAEAAMNFGIVLAEEGNEAAAVTQYEAALRRRPEYAMARYNLGNALVRLRRWREARAQFAAALRLEPGLDAAREMLERLPAEP